MAIYYIENPNGKYPSEDGSRRFDKLSGRTAYEYLQTTEGKGIRFMKANEAEDRWSSLLSTLEMVNSFENCNNTSSMKKLSENDNVILVSKFNSS